MHVNTFMNWEPLGAPLDELVMDSSKWFIHIIYIKKFVDSMNFKSKSTRRRLLQCVSFVFSEAASLWNSTIVVLTCGYIHSAIQMHYAVKAHPFVFDQKDEKTNVWFPVTAVSVY